MTVKHVAVIDIGKTNAKLALVDASNLSEIAVVTRPNTVLTGPPWPHFDVDGHWDFLLNNLRGFHAEYGVDAISITTHGACAALLDKTGALAAPILDYEHAGPDEVIDLYNMIRPPFSETGSPPLAGGLNIGAQLFWQFHEDPQLKDRTDCIVTYPQYWGARLTGNRALDVTSLGCHTDLWNPHTGTFSSLVDKLGIADKLPPARKPSDFLGPILPEVAILTGLPESTPVFVGIHDSNASLLPYVLSEKKPFSVVSTGTWVIAMSLGGHEARLDPKRDTLMNVTALGDPAPSARFMGGREHDLATGGQYAHPTANDLSQVISNQLMLMPAVVENVGPFKNCHLGWVGQEPIVGTGARNAAVSLYLALVTAECLGNIGHDGKIIVEGPFAGNEIYLQMLEASTGSPTFRALGTTGTSAGAALTAITEDAAKRALCTRIEVDDQRHAMLQNYASRWRNTVAIHNN